MSESLLFILLILLFTTFADSQIFTATLVLIMSNGEYLLDTLNFYLNVFLNSYLPSVSVIPYLIMSPSYFKDIPIGMMIFILVLVLLTIIGVGYYLNFRGSFILESRRFHKSMCLMKIIYAMILLSAAIILLNSGIAVSNYSTILIFMIALFAFFKFRISPMFIIVISLVISYLLY